MFRSLITLLGLFLIMGCGENSIKTDPHHLSIVDCQTCERLTNFSRAKEMISKSLWKGLNTLDPSPPLLYFTDSTTYIAFSEENPFDHQKSESIPCSAELNLQKFNRRIDDQPFHMENKMNFNDSLSPYYYRPAMLCSDVETMHQFVPDFETTEEWLQLVMHEYFHSYQFSHKPTIDFLADTISMSADTLNKIYNSNPWFQKDLELENNALIKALETNVTDSITTYINEFIKIRSNRRLKFREISEFDLETSENFWETIEGTARYVEYHMAMEYKNIQLSNDGKCDSLFHDFKNYSISSTELESREEFKQRRMMIQAYYYVTGFHLCELLEKMGYEYKNHLFAKPKTGLYKTTLEAVSIAHKY